MIRHVAATATPKNGSECIIINARYRKGDRTSARLFQTWNHESCSQAIIHKWWNYRMVRRKNAFNWKCSRNWGSFVIRNFERKKKNNWKKLAFPANATPTLQPRLSPSLSQVWVPKRSAQVHVSNFTPRWPFWHLTGHRAAARLWSLQAINKEKKKKNSRARVGKFSQPTDIQKKNKIKKQKPPLGNRGFYSEYFHAQRSPIEQRISQIIKLQINWKADRGSEKNTHSD